MRNGDTEVAWLRHLRQIRTTLEKSVSVLGTADRSRPELTRMVAEMEADEAADIAQRMCRELASECWPDGLCG